MGDSLCLICGGNAVFKIKDENIFYCKEHAEEFFSLDCLQKVQKIELGVQQAEVLRDYLFNNS